MRALNRNYRRMVRSMVKEYVKVETKIKEEVEGKLKQFKKDNETRFEKAETEIKKINRNYSNSKHIQLL